MPACKPNTWPQQRELNLKFTHQEMGSLMKKMVPPRAAVLSPDDVTRMATACSSNTWRWQKPIPNQLTWVPTFIRVMGARILTAVSCTTSTSTLSWQGGREDTVSTCQTETRFHFQAPDTVVPLSNHCCHMICTTCQRKYRWTNSVGL